MSRCIVHLIFIAFASLAFSIHVPAQVIYVDADAAGANDGSSWANAYTDLSSALAVASSTDVWVAEGTYSPDPTAPYTTTTSFALIDGVAIYGGFDGTETSLSERNLTDHVTVLTGDNAGDDTLPGGGTSDNATRVVTGVANSSSAVLDGVVIERASVTGISITGSPTFTRCTVRDNGNTASMSALVGGVRVSLSGAPIFTECVIENNIGYIGAGVSTFDTSPRFVNCGFFGNVSGNVGGAMDLSGNGFVTLTNCVFSNNTAAAIGGAILKNANVNLTIHSSTFGENSVSSISGGGGGLFLAGGQAFIRNSIFWGNADAFGTGLSAQINGTTFADIEFTCMQGFTGGFGVGNTGADPVFLNVAGEDATKGTSDDNLRPFFTSTSPFAVPPIVDAGSNAALPSDSTDLDDDANTSEALPLDADESARIVDGDGNSTATTDMGAYEFRGCQEDIGYAGPGAIRIEICGDDLRTSGGTGTFLLTGGAPGQQALLVIGVTQINLPRSLGMSTLVPSPDNVTTMMLDSNGEITFAVPGGPNSIDTLWVQVVGSQPGFDDYSNALEVEIGLP